ncbi:guanine nucleotide-binding protein g(o) subunit alpha [Anaeramoeba flamelloides]|uniref:Guanine nucleotide-binding protein g(O) subunit alpha n=1 Tax=Anaeramoeba flamelloides TaxID=1746091 RepID=A0ABQ8YQA6_9EUKA|nr:guanine nucleotide-binding protein g(o) subunit alpha [Anaeramoeba flamelloides]
MGNKTQKKKINKRKLRDLNTRSKGIDQQIKEDQKELKKEVSYLDHIDRITQENYVPTNKDIIYCRIPTTGVNVVDFNVNDFPWKIVDVGGQRSERRKWIHHFADVSCLIYVVAINEFDQKLYEDETINRLQESLFLFQNTANNKWFKKTDCVLLFNKIDLFVKKMQKVPLKKCFKKYRGGQNPSRAQNFIAKKFIEVAQNENRSIFTFSSIGTDTKNIKNVFEAIRNKLVQKNLENMGVC